LAYPERFDRPYGEMDWSEAVSLTFEPPDRAAFRCLDLAFEAGRRGGTAPAWLSAANEVCVDAFLEGLMPWTGIAETNEELLMEHDGSPADSLEAVLDADARARERTWRRIREIL
jgi:1-deoxy-D-xylulose-5-phosphate reductoisomerase